MKALLYWDSDVRFEMPVSWANPFINKWRPFTASKAPRNCSVPYRILSANKNCCSSTKDGSPAVDQVADHQVSESKEAPELHCNRRRWLLLASGSAALAEADTKEAAAQQLGSLLQEPTIKETRSLRAYNTAISTGIQAVRTPSIYRFVLEILFSCMLTHCQCHQAVEGTSGSMNMNISFMIQGPSNRGCGEDKSAHAGPYPTWPY